MAYGLIYYKNYTRNGKTIRLEIAEREADETAGKEIGNFVSCELHLNEGNAAIDEAIHKSTLVFSMVNAPDMADTATTKYSGWEILYTHDATQYAVSLYEDGVNTWNGFITPDSWTDNLVYRGIISITCRDNIGRMADIEYDAAQLVPVNGFATAWQIIRAGLVAASCPYAYYNTGADYHMLKYNNQSMFDWAFDCSGFEGKTWYEIVEDVCVALGLVIRPDGRGKLIVSPFRSLPLLANASAAAVPVSTPVFLNRSGSRTIQSSYKKITESVSYEALPDLVDVFDSANSKWTYGNALHQYGITNNPYGDESGGREKYALLTVNDSSTSTRETASRIINVSNRAVVSIKFNLAHSFEYDDEGSYVDSSKYIPQNTDVVYVLAWQTGANTLYWNFANKAWQPGNTYGASSISSGNETAAVELGVTTPDSKGKLKLTLSLEHDYFEEEHNEERVRIGDFTVSIDSASFPARMNVTSRYDEQYNLVLSRSPKFAQCPSWMLSAGSIVNGIYCNDSANYYPPVKGCAWDDLNVSLPIAVHMHMQILAFHAKPNNILSGDIIPATGEFDMRARWEIYNRKFILTSATYDVLTGHINNAVLTEYDDYEDVCGEMTADYTYKDNEYNASNTNAQTLTVSGGGGGTGGGVSIAEVQAYLTANHYVHDLDSTQIVTALGFTPANSSQTYTKAQTNTELAKKADKSSTYTKTETNAILPKVHVSQLTQDDDGDFVGATYAEIKAKYDAGYVVMISNDGNVYTLTEHAMRTEGGVMYGKFTFNYLDASRLYLTLYLDQKSGWAYGTDTTLLNEADIAAKGYLKKADADRYYAGKAHQSVMAIFEQSTHQEIRSYISEGWNVVVRHGGYFYHLSEVNDVDGTITWFRFGEDDSHWRVTLNIDDLWDEEGGL